MNAIRLITKYQLVLIGRSWIFRFIAILLICFIAYRQFLIQANLGGAWWKWIALSSSFPFYNAYLFNLLQSLLILFVVTLLFSRNKTSETSEVLEVHPVSNNVYFAGKVVAVLLSILLLSLFSILFSVLLQVFRSPAPLRFWMYLFYFFTLMLPSLVFVLGVILLFYHWLRKGAFALLISAVFLGIFYYILPDFYHGLLDCWGRVIPNQLSDVTGHPDLYAYLFHRLGFLFLGVGCMGFALKRMVRIPNEPRKMDFKYSYLPFLCGIAMLFLYGWGIGENDATRDRYRMSYLKYETAEKARVITHKITCGKAKDIYSAASDLVVRNTTRKGFSNIVLYLNPALKVSCLEVNGKSVRYHRDNQVLVVEQPLALGEELSLHVEYFGKLDGRVCYLDISNKNYYYPKTKNSLFKQGIQHVFMEKNYLLLHPESLWYPVTVPPLYLKSSARIMNFTRYTLEVEEVSGQEVISQGNRSVIDGKVLFTNTHDLSGISLVIGNYQKMKFQLDSLDLELYYFPGNDFFVSDSVQVPVDSLLAGVKCYFEAEFKRKYPFQKLVVLETPASFCSYERQATMRNGYVQPEMVFLPERMNNCEEPQFGVFRGNLRDFDERNLIISIYNLFGSNKRNMTPMFSDYIGFVSSDVYPGIGKVFSDMCSGFSDDEIRWRAECFPIHEKMVDYFSKKSFRDVLFDAELSDSERSFFFKRKIMLLQAILTTTIPWDSLKNFISDFFVSLSFKEVDFERFNTAFEKEFGGDSLPAILSQWYMEKGLPTFRIKGVDVKKMPGDGNAKYSITADVYNASDVDGVVSLSFNTWVTGVLRNFIWNYRVKAGECKRVCAISDFRPGEVQVGTCLSNNLPSDVVFSFRKKPKEESASIRAGMTDLEPGEFDNPNEIVVDNEDAGFHVVDSTNRRSLLADLYEKKDNIGLNPRIWATRIRSIFYGYPKRSAYYKMAGTGKAKAEWDVVLPKAGYYEVFFYHHDYILSLEGNRHGSKLSGSRLNYTVYHAQLEDNVEVDAYKEEIGWVSLGKYYFPAGKARVVLSDKGGKQILNEFRKPDDRVRQLIIADAIKWYYIGD